VLEGELARQWIARLRQRAAGTPLQDASVAATRADWPAVASAVEKAGSTLPDADALLGLSRFGRRNFPEAAAAFKAYTSVHPDDATAAFILGWAQAAAGNDRAAVAAFRSAMAAEPTLVPPYLAAIDAYLRMREPSLALQVAHAGLIAMPTSPELRDRVIRLERK
jgi:tetratricopeptide (TPR) repeat protein